MTYNHNNHGASGGFFSKIKENYSNKFSNLSISAMQSERDGNSEDDTLIHNAFVKYFDSKGQPYPEWLGVKQSQQHGDKNGYSSSNKHYNSPYQPVYYNDGTTNNYNQGQQSSQSLPIQSQQRYAPSQQQAPQQPTYQPRSSSRLQDMYNKSRQQSIPGSGYNTQPYQPSPIRSNSYSTTGSRLREKMLHTSTSMTQLNQSASSSSSSSISRSTGGSRATWGRR